MGQVCSVAARFGTLLRALARYYVAATHLACAHLLSIRPQRKFLQDREVHCEAASALPTFLE